MIVIVMLCLESIDLFSSLLVPVLWLCPVLSYWNLLNIVVLLTAGSRKCESIYGNVPHVCYLSHCP